MQLRKTGIATNGAKTHVEFELVATDLLMISVDNDINDQKGLYCYWRIAGSGVNPPLEVGINTDTKAIKWIVLFVDADCFNNFQLTSEENFIGNILVDSSIFIKSYDFIDTNGNYYVSLTDNKLICKFSEECKIKESIVNGNIEFYIDYNDQLIGFAINNLTESELITIKTLI